MNEPAASSRISAPGAFILTQSKSSARPLSHFRLPGLYRAPAFLAISLGQLGIKTTASSSLQLLTCRIPRQAISYIRLKLLWIYNLKMENIILPSPSLHVDPDGAQSPSNGSAKRPRLASFSTSRDSSISWGRRHHHGSWLHALGCASIMCLCPCLAIFVWISLSSFQGSLTAAYNSIWESGPVEFFHLYAPRPTLNASVGYVAWFMFQAALYQCLPSQLSTGQLTPAGHLLKYRTNGLLAWGVTLVLFLAASIAGALDPATLATNWEGLLVAVNVFGFLLSGFAYVKARFSPTHEDDRKFSGEVWILSHKSHVDSKIGSALYDLYMGVELNPIFGKYFDFKLFTNGRPGIIAWTLM